MRTFFVCLAAALAATVIAEDIFYYDQLHWALLHRFNHICYLMTLTEDQHNGINNVEGIIAVQTLMRQLQNDPAHTHVLNEAEHTPFIVSHCHNRPVINVVQPQPTASP